MANSESVEYLNQARYFVGVEQYNDALEYINKAIATDKFNKELYGRDFIDVFNMALDAAIEINEDVLIQ